MGMVAMKLEDRKVPWILRLLSECRLKICGPMEESKLAFTVLLIQGICSGISFFLHYNLPFFPSSLCGVPWLSTP